MDQNAAGALIDAVTVADQDDDGHALPVDDARFEIVAGVLKPKAGAAPDQGAEANVTVTFTATDRHDHRRVGQAPDLRAGSAAGPRGARSPIMRRIPGLPMAADPGGGPRVSNSADVLYHFAPAIRHSPVFGGQVDWASVRSGTASGRDGTARCHHVPSWLAAAPGSSRLGFNE